MKVVYTRSSANMISHKRSFTSWDLVTCTHAVVFEVLNVIVPEGIFPELHEKHKNKPRSAEEERSRPQTSLKRGAMAKNAGIQM